MKTRIIPLLLAGLLSLMASACGQPAPATQSFQDTPVANQTNEPVVATNDGATEAVVDNSTLLPIGFVSNTGDGLGLSLFAMDGLTLGEIRLPGAELLSKNNVLVTGVYSGNSKPDLVYFQFAVEGNCDACGLWLVKDEKSSQLTHFHDIEGVIGAAGTDLVVAVERLPLPESSILRSNMYLGEPADLVEAQPVMTVDNRESLGIVPVAIQIKDGKASGIYYTQRPYGIGGEILFDPLMGLSLFDLATKTTQEIMPETAAFSSISASQTYVAYSVRGTGPDGGLMIRDLTSQKDLLIQALPDSDRGAGMVVFNANDTRLAWLEGHGSLSEGNFHATVRVAGMDGKNIQEFPQEGFVKTAGLGEAIWVTPLGWLDNNNLLVGVSSMGKDSQSAILRLDVQSGQVTYLTAGEFMGFLYP